MANINFLLKLEPETDYLIYVIRTKKEDTDKNFHTFTDPEKFYIRIFSEGQCSFSKA